jgi:hypothetical protein
MHLIQKILGGIRGHVGFGQSDHCGGGAQNVGIRPGNSACQWLEFNVSNIVLIRRIDLIRWTNRYSGDTKPCQNLVNAGQDSTVLIHEATMADDQITMAEEKAHSTIGQAVDVAKR